MPNFAIRDLSPGDDTIIAVGSKILVSRVVDTGAALHNANGPNSTNPFTTRQDLVSVSHDVLAEVQTMIDDSRLTWGGTI